jgi:transcriptional regulator with XRE-family HTH domain
MPDELRKRGARPGRPRPTRIPVPDAGLVVAGSFIRSCRKKLRDSTNGKRVTLNAAAAALGISKTMMYLVESGKIRPSVQLLDDIQNTYLIDDDDMANVRYLYGQPNDEEIEVMRKAWEKHVGAR